MWPFNWFRNWIRKLSELRFQRPSRPRHQRKYCRQVRFVPFLELLEARLAPATDYWTGLSLVSQNWNDPANWSSSATTVVPVTPSAGDNLVFQAPLPGGSGSLTSNNNFAPGTSFGSITFAGGGYTVSGNALTLAAGITDTGNNTFQAGLTLNGSETVTLSSGTLTLGGTNLFASGATISGSGTLTVNSGAALTINSANPSLFTGNTIDNGTLIVGTGTALGTGTLTLNTGSTFQANAGALANPVAFGNNAAVTFSGNNPITFSGNSVTLSGADTLLVNNTTTINDAIGGSGASLTLASGSSGFLVLAPAANNTYSGGTTLSGGTLVLGSTNQDLGTGTLTLTGGTLETSVSGGFTVTNPLAFNNATVTFAGSNNLLFASSSAGSLQGTNTVTVTNTGSTTIAEALTGSGGLTLAGPGTLLLTGTDSYTGATTVNGGTLTLTGASGVLTATSSITINAGGALLLDDTAGNVSSGTRLTATVPMNLNGGTLSVNGTNATSTATSESIGTVTLTGGASTISATKGTGGTLTLTGFSLTRPTSSGATVNVNDNNSGASLGAGVVIAFSTTPTLTPSNAQPGSTGILPYATVSTGTNLLEFATYSGGSIVRYGAVGTAYASSVASAAAGANVNNSTASAGDSLGTNTTLNSLTFSGGGTATLNLFGGTLTITSGALLVTNGTSLTISNGTLVLGSEGIITAAPNASVTINASINTAAGNLTVSGGGTVTLGVANANLGGSNTVSVNGSTLILGITGALTSGTGTITLADGGTLTVAGTTAQSLANTITGVGSTLNTVSVTNTNTTALSGLISGAVALTENTASTLTLSNSNTFTGGTTLSAGTLVLSTNTAAGSGTLTLANGTTLQAGAASLVFYNPLSLSGSITFSGSNAITFDGAASLTGATTLNVTNTGGTIVNGVISGDYALNLASTSSTVLTLNNANTYTGGTTLNSGTGSLTVGNNSALGGGTLTLGNGVTLTANLAVTLSNLVSFVSSAGVSISGSAPITLSGNVTLLGTNTITLSNTGGTTLSGNLSGGSLSFAGSGTVFLPNANSSLSGAVTIGGTAVVVIGSSTSLGTGNLTLNTGVTLLAGGSSVVINNTSQIVTFNGAVTLGGTTSGGAINSLTFGSSTSINLNTATTLVVTNTTTFNGTVGGSGLTLNGSIGTLALTNNNNNFSSLVLNAGTTGTLSVGNNGALGSGGLTFTSGVLNNSTVGTLTFANSVTTLTAVAFTGGNMTFNGTVTLPVGGATVQLGVGTTVTFQGPVGGTGALTLSGLPIVSGNSTVVSTGTLIIGTTDSSTGGITINGGTLQLGGSTQVLTGAGGAITLNQGGTLLLQPTTATALINSVQTLTLGGGTLNLQGGSNAAVTQTLGAVTLNAGSSTIIISNSGTTGSAILNFGNLGNGTAGGMLNIQAGQTGSLQALSSAGGNGTNQVTFTGVTTGATGTFGTAGTGVLPRVTVTDSQSVTVGGSGVGTGTFENNVSNPGGFKLGNSTAATNFNIVPVLTYTSFLTAGGNSGNLAITTTTGTTNYSSSVTADSVNSILFIGDGETISGGTNLNLSVTSGEIANTRGGLTTNVGNAISVATLTLVAEGKILTNDGTLSINSVITGSAGLTVSGGPSGSGGQLNLNGLNTYIGADALVGGTLQLGSATAITTGSTFTLINGTLQSSVSGGSLITNALAINNSSITLGGTTTATNQPLLFTGAVTTTTATTATLTVNTVNNVSPTVVFEGIIGAGPIASNLVKSGSGTLILVGANAFTGFDFVNQGILQVQNSTGTGAGTTYVSNNAAVQLIGITANALTKPFILNGSGPSGGGALENLVGGGAATFAGTITLNTSSTIGVDANTTFTQAAGGTITGPGTLTKVGIGTLGLILANTYTGNTTIGAGILNLSAAAATLGTVVSTATVNSGATLQVSAALANPWTSLTLNGTGFGNTATQANTLPIGALVLTTANSSWNGNITLANSASIGAANTFTLTVNGTISSSDTTGLTKVGGGSVTLNDSNTFQGNLTVGTGTLTLANANTYSGATTVSGNAVAGAFVGGNLTLVGLGTALNSSSFTVNQNSTLVLDNNNGAANPGTGFNSAARISATRPITLNSATLQINANNNAGIASSQTLGVLTLASGQSTIQVGYTAVPLTNATSTVNVLSLTRNTGATVNFIGGTVTAGVQASPLGTATNQLLINNLSSANTGTAGTFISGGLQYLGTTTGAAILNILQFAEVNGGATVSAGDLATYTGSGIAAVPAASYLTQTFSTTGTITAGLSTDIVKIVATGTPGYTITAPAGWTVGALVFVNNATNGAVTLSVPTASTMTVNSGAIMVEGSSNAGNTIITGATATTAINLPVETFLFQNLVVNGTNNVQMGVALAGTGSLVIAGSGAVDMHNVAGAPSTYTGGTFINSATNVFLSSTAVGVFGTGAITLTGGTINSNAAASTISNAINLNGVVGFSNNAGGDLTVFTGAVTLTNNTFLTVNGTAATNVSFDGAISGPNSLTVVGGTGTVILNNANTYAGGTVLDGGLLQVGHSNALGAGTLTLAGGTILASVSVNLPNAVVIPNTTVTIAGTNNLTFSGSTTLIGTATLAVTDTGLVTFSGVISGTGQLTTAGSNAGSVLVLSGNNTYSGGTTVNGAAGATILVGNNNAFGTGAIISSVGANNLYAATNITLANNFVLGTFGLSFTGSLTNGSFTLNGNVLVTSTADTVTVNNSTTLNGVIMDQGAGGHILTVSGTGTLTLNSASSILGGITLSAAGSAANVLGTLAVNNSGAIGGGALSLNTGVFQANTAVTLPNAVTVGAATVVAFTGSNITFNGAVAQTAAPLWLLNTTVTLAGGVGTNAVLTLSGTPVITGTTTLLPTGNLILDSADSSTSAINIVGGTLTLAGNAARLTSASAITITINPGGTLALQPTSTTQLITTAPTVTLSGGTINFQGGSGIAATQSFGGVTLSAGASNIIISNGGSSGTAALAFGALSNSTAGGTLNIQSGQNGSLQQLTSSLSSTSNTVTFSSVTTAATNNVLPRVTVTDSQTVTVGATSGITSNLKMGNYSGTNIVPLLSYAAFVAGGGGNGTLNYGITSASNTYSSGVTADSVNSILFIGDGETISGGASTMNLTVTSGQIASTASTGSGNAISVTTLTPGAEAVFTVNAGNGTSSGDLIINSIIAGGAIPVTIAGPGMVNLTSAGNTYSGGTYLAGGTLALGTANLSGSANAINAGGTLTVLNGTILANTPAVLTNVVNIGPSAGTGAYSLTVGGSNNITFSAGGIVLNGTGNNTISVSNSAATVVSGVISGANTLTKAGSGTLTLTATNTITGQRYIIGGTVNLQNLQGLGTTNSAAVATGATVQLQGGIALAAANPAFILAGGTMESVYGTNSSAATVAIISPSTIQVDAAGLTLSGVISGAGDITKTGAGTLSLNAANTDTGQININNGIVNYNNASSFGAVTAPVVVNSGATLQISTTALTVLRPLQLNGTGYTATNLAGALQLSAAAATWAGNITLNPGTSIGVGSAETITVTGIISGSANLVKVGAGTMILQAANTYTGNTIVDAGALTFNTSGTAVNSGASIPLTGTATNSSTSITGLSSTASLAVGMLVTSTATGFPSGATITAINSSTAITISSNFMGTTGTVSLTFGTPTSTAYIVNPGATLTLDNNIGSVNLAARIPSASALTLNGGTFILTGGNGSGVVGLATTQSVGTITLNSGNSTIETNSGSLAGASRRRRST